MQAPVINQNSKRINFTSIPSQEPKAKIPAHFLANQKKDEIDVLKCSVRLDTTMEEFESKGGEKMFVQNLAESIGIEKSNIKVTQIREGSVIVDYEISIVKQMPSKDQI